MLEPGKYIRLEVSDNGPGIERSVQKRIFVPYFTTKEVGRGTSLGLAVALGIVKSLRGRINVYSDPDEGSTFSVYLPITETEVVDEVLTHEEGFYAQNNERIMVVDDESGIREILKEYLVNFGYPIDVFENGQDGWNAFKREPDSWNLLITDQTMPRLTGTSLIPRIKEKRLGMPVILCSGYSEILNRKKIEELGINAFLHKPATMDKLL